MAGRAEGRGAGNVRDAGLQEGEGGGCGPRVLPGLFDLLQQLNAANRQAEHSSGGRSWSGVHMPLLARGGGVATGAGVYCPSRQTEEAHARRPNFSGTSSAIGIWAACRTACTSLGSAQKAATTSRVRRRSYDGVRWGARNWLMGL